MLLYEIAKRLGTYGGNGISLRQFGTCFLLETSKWDIYLSSMSEQYNKKVEGHSLEPMGTCPDELIIAHQLLGVLIERLH